MKNGHAAAYAAWFKRFESARKSRHIAPGRKVPGFPAPPPGPDDVRQLLEASANRLTMAGAASLCGVHRTTVSRWLDGSVQIPDAAFALLRFHADGVPPGCGDAWRGFSWSADALICPDGKTRVTAQEIAGLGYQRAAFDAACRKIAELESLCAKLAGDVQWNSANDAFVSGPAARAFGA